MNIEIIKKEIGEWWNLLFDQDQKVQLIGQLMKFIDLERQEKEIYPKDEEVFRSLQLTQPKNVKVVIIGQDLQFIK